MPVDLFRTAGRTWHTMTSGDITMCMDYANTLAPGGRGPEWMDAFAAKAEQLGYRQGAGRCNCGEVHGPECGLAKLYQHEPVWPHDCDDGLMQGKAAPRNFNPLPPQEPHSQVTPYFLPPIPADAVYSGGTPDSDPDDLRDAA